MPVFNRVGGEAGLLNRCRDFVRTSGPDRDGEVGAAKKTGQRGVEVVATDLNQIDD
jgi:hypothetical protein